MSAKKLTPVMRQYEDAKAQHPDAILFFRMGDFYEMFHGDAVLVSKALGLTLTARNKGDPDEIPMAGVPYHAAHSYLARLLAQGHKVAICDQMADPSKVKGIVPRQVTRVLTPGLVTDGEQLDARTNHFLAALDAGDSAGAGPHAGDGKANGAIGFALLDLSIGELLAGELADGASVMAELARSEAREVLLGPGLEELLAAAKLVAPRAALRTDDALDAADVHAAIDGAVDAPIAEAAARELSPLGLRAAARALRFAARCTPSARIPVRRVAVYEAATALVIDETAQAHLELARAADGARKGSLLDVVDATETPAGARLLRRRLLAPLVDVAEIRRRLDQVDLFVANPRARADARAALAHVGDLERLTVRALLGEVTPKDLGNLRDGLAAAPLVAAAVASIPDPAARELLGEADLVPDLAALLARALVDRPGPLPVATARSCARASTRSSTSSAPSARRAPSSSRSSRPSSARRRTQGRSASATRASSAGTSRSRSRTSRRCAPRGAGSRRSPAPSATRTTRSTTSPIASSTRRRARSSASSPCSRASCARSP